MSRLLLVAALIVAGTAAVAAQTLGYGQYQSLHKMSDFFRRKIIDNELYNSIDFLPNSGNPLPNVEVYHESYVYALSDRIWVGNLQTGGTVNLSLVDLESEDSRFRGPRALASRMLDYGIVFGASAGVQTLTTVSLGVPSVDWFVDRSWLLSIWTATTMSVPMWTYNTALVAGPRQATLGHRALGVSVVTLDGQPISPGRSLLRSAVMFMGWELAHVAMFVPRNFATDDAAAWQYVGLVAATAYLVADIVATIATGGQRSIADLVVGTRLVRTASP